MNLGEYLKSKRLESGKSLEQVAASTKIHIKILKAIEGNFYAELPARTFTRGFIVNYAKALKLDPEQVLKDHESFLEEHFAERAQRDQGHQGYAFEGKELEQNRRWLIIGASIALIFAVAVLLVFKPQNHKRKEKHKEFEEEASLTESKPEDSEAPLLLETPKPKIDSSAALPVTSPIAGTPNASLSPQLEIPALLAANKNASPSASPIQTASPAAKTSSSPHAEAPTPSPTMAAKGDPLNKGDDLSSTEVKRKISIQAKDDVWIRFKSDQRPANLILLRKGRFLIIKGKEQVLFEVLHPESVSYKTKGTYQDLSTSKNQIEENSSVQGYTGNALGSTPIPEQIPPPREH